MLDLQPKSSFRITEDSKFFNKLLSKERTAAESSFRVCGSVPFTWELRPGTPKNALSHSSLPLPPPLTPPPSYHRRRSAGKLPRSNLFYAFLMRISLKRVKNVASLRSSRSLSSSTNSSVFLELAPQLTHQGSLNSALDSSFDADADIEQPTTPLCFRITGGRRSR